MNFNAVASIKLQLPPLISPPQSLLQQCIKLKCKNMKMRGLLFCFARILGQKPNALPAMVSGEVTGLLAALRVCGLGQHFSLTGGRAPQQGMAALAPRLRLLRNGVWAWLVYVYEVMTMLLRGSTSGLTSLLGEKPTV